MKHQSDLKKSFTTHKSWYKTNVAKCNFLYTIGLQYYLSSHRHRSNDHYISSRSGTTGSSGSWSSCHISHPVNSTPRNYFISVQRTGWKARINSWILTWLLIGGICFIFSNIPPNLLQVAEISLNLLNRPSSIVEFATCHYSLWTTRTRTRS